MVDPASAIQLVSRPHGAWIEVSVVDAGSQPVTRGAFVRALASDPEVRTELDRCIADAPFQALFFEMPPLTHGRLDAAARFVLVEARSLLRMLPDPHAFAEHLRGPGPAVRSFSNLSGDSLLVAPRDDGPPATYVHLAAFCRDAPPEQRDLLWRVVAEETLERVEHRDAPLWVSTSGLGVGWLHVRLDARPKYYSHRPYRALDA
jgi:hypothetical protein